MEPYTNTELGVKYNDSKHMYTHAMPGDESDPSWLLYKYIFKDSLVYIETEYSASKFSIGIICLQFSQ